MTQSSVSHATKPWAAANPTKTTFGPWHSSSTGHQTDKNRLSGSTIWRDSRTFKLADQFRDGNGGGKRLADRVCTGSEGSLLDGDVNPQLQARDARSLRTSRQRSLEECFKVGKKANTSSQDQAKKAVEGPAVADNKNDDGAAAAHDDTTPPTKADTTVPTSPPKKQLFRGLTVYVNGSTYPLISDHKLKRQLAAHGARISLALGRRTVTHVIIGLHNRRGGAGAGAGAGGGLASSKLEKEISAVRAKGIKYVGAEWALESIKAGKRLPEGPFSHLKLARESQRSVVGYEIVKTKLSD